MDNQFQPLSGGEVLSIDHSAQFMIGHSTFRASEFVEILRSKMLEYGIGGLTQEKSAWFTERGIRCEVLRFGAGGWEKGRVRIHLEFAPDDSVEDITPTTPVSTPEVPKKSQLAPPQPPTRVETPTPPVEPVTNKVDEPSLTTTADEGDALFPNIVIENQDKDIPPSPLGIGGNDDDLDIGVSQTTSEATLVEADDVDLGLGNSGFTLGTDQDDLDLGSSGFTLGEDEDNLGLGLEEPSGFDLGEDDDLGLGLEDPSGFGLGEDDDLGLGLEDPSVSNLAFEEDDDLGLNLTEDALDDDPLFSGGFDSGGTDLGLDLEDDHPFGDHDLGLDLPPSLGDDTDGSINIVNNGIDDVFGLENDDDFASLSLDTDSGSNIEEIDFSQAFGEDDSLDFGGLGNDDGLDLNGLSEDEDPFSIGSFDTNSGLANDQAMENLFGDDEPDDVWKDFNE